MTVTAKTICDRVEYEAERLGIKAPDRVWMFNFMTRDLNRLLFEVGVVDWAIKTVSGSTITISSGARSADLPADFGDNFIRYSGPAGNQWLCKLVDTSTTPSTERDLRFQSAAQLYDWDHTSTATRPPTWYTVQSKASGMGTKQIVTDSLTDKAYQVRGVYVPTSWAFSDDADLPIVNQASTFLENALLRKVLPPKSEQWAMADADFNRDRNAIMFDVASNRNTRLMPILQQYGYGNSYGQIYPS